MLTGKEIADCVTTKRLVIHPFRGEHLNPNSYDVTLAKTLYRVYDDALDLMETYDVDEVVIPKSGYVLRPGECYLGVTQEYTYTPHHAPQYEGRSTMARYFIASHATAGFGDIGFSGHWTLEITVTKPVRIYPGIRIGQLSFHTPDGLTEQQYTGNYIDDDYHTNPRPRVGLAGNI